MKEDDLKEYKKYVSDKLRGLTPIFAKSSIGEYSENIEIPDEDDEFTELYAGVQVMVEVIRFQLAELRELNQSLEQKVKEMKDSEEVIRQSEHKFRAVSEIVQSSILIIQGTKFVYANPYNEIMTGYTIEELQNKDFWDIVHPDFRELVKERGLERLRGGDVPKEYEFKIVTKWGEEKWVQTSATLMEYEGQKATLAVVFDITERKRTEQKIKDSLSEKEMLLKEIHHRVKNNLQIMSSLLNIQSQHIRDNDSLEIFKES
ncbi:MAG: PAS domain S-box protein, partial [Ignavibacteria bacterium]